MRRLSVNIIVVTDSRFELYRRTLWNVAHAFS